MRIEKKQIERTVDQNWKRRLAELREANNNAAWSMSEFINETPCAITERLMKEADPSGELPEEILYAAFMAGFCGISEDDTTINEYFHDAVHCLETRKYRDNPYLENIKFPDTATRHWKFTHYSYRPYEAFICNDIDIDKNLREVPQIGFFRERFAYPAVEQDGREWMAVKPSEIETMRAPIEEATGRVVTFRARAGILCLYGVGKAGSEVTGHRGTERGGNRIVRKTHPAAVPQQRKNPDNPERCFLVPE